jgi:hypothetical protein
MTSPPSLLPSTADPARPSVGEPPQRPSTTSYTPANTAALGRPLNLKPYASWAFTRRATESGLVASIGGVGACYNNAMIESFWPAYRFCCSSGAAGGPASSSPTIFEYLEIFHNASADTAPWAMLSPVEFENRQPTTVA